MEGSVSDPVTVSSTETLAPAPHKHKPLWQQLLKWGLFVVVLFFVGRHLLKMWQDGQAHTISVRWEFVGAAILLFTMSWIPSIIAWRRLLTLCHQPAPLLITARAHYTGHFGKYVPGKAMALAIRGWIMRDSAGVPMRLGVLTAGYEAIAFMAAGAFWAVIFLPVGMGKLLREWKVPEGWWWVWPLVMTTLLLVSLPVVTRVMNHLSRKMASAVTETPPLSIGSLQLLGLLGLLSVAWFIKSIALASLWVSVCPPEQSPPQWATCMAAATIANVGGFIVLFAPAGLGPRELLMVEVFSQPNVLTQPQIATITILARLVSFLGEAVGAGIFTIAVRLSLTARKPAIARTTAD